MIPVFFLHSQKLRKPNDFLLKSTMLITKTRFIFRVDHIFLTLKTLHIVLERMNKL
jgi:hypothetical protein